MFALLAILFFLSGASALVYQLLWLRLLGLVFGVTVHAASTVWAAFMTGLALGSMIAGLAGDRVRRPLAWFGAAEILTGVTAVLTPAAIAALQSVMVSDAASLPTAGAGSVVPRFVMAFAVLLVPTVLMGATLPLVVRSSSLSRSHLGSRAGALYAANTAGAIAGTLGAGLLLIPQVGLRTSFTIAAALNLLVGVIAIVMASKSAPFGTSEIAVARDDGVGIAARESARTGGQRTIVLIVFTISGFASLALEVVWFRVITLFLRPTVYGYAFMLATLLFGIAAGSALATPLMRRRFERLLALALLEGALALTSLLSFTALGWIPRSVQLFEPVLRPILGPYLAYQAVACAVVILPTALLLGIAFPIGLSVWLGEDTSSSSVARRTGVFYSLNLAGAIVGSLTAGFVLLPGLGSRGSLIALAVLTLAGTFMLLWRSDAARGARLAAAIGCGAACAVAASAVPDPFDEFLRQRYADERIVWRREAVQATVSVHERADGTMTLNVSGNHQASSSGSMPFVHRRIGNLPMAVHPDPRTALVIGLGGGATAGALFRPINGALLRQPHARVLVDDGRNFLLLTKQRYDVITADVILPIHAGAGNLYSTEYFRLVRRALKPGGMAVQWVAGTDAEYKLIMRTFLSVFPQTTLWADGSLMIGAMEPLRLRRTDLEWKLQVPCRRQMLAELGITSFEKLRALYRAGPDELRRYVGTGPVLTDDRPQVEYFLSLPRDRQVDLSDLTGDVGRYVDDGPSSR